MFVCCLMVGERGYLFVGNVLSVVCCLFVVAFRSVRADSCSLLVVCCLLLVVCCLLFVLG